MKRIKLIKYRNITNDASNESDQFIVLGKTLDPRSEVGIIRNRELHALATIESVSAKAKATEEQGVLKITLGDREFYTNKNARTYNAVVAGNYFIYKVVEIRELDEVEHGNN